MYFTFTEFQKHCFDLITLKNHFMGTIALYREILTFKSSLFDEDSYYRDTERFYEERIKLEEIAFYLSTLSPKDKKISKAILVGDYQLDAVEMLTKINEDITNKIKDFQSNSIKYLIAKMNAQTVYEKERFMQVFDDCIVVGKLNNGKMDTKTYTCGIYSDNGRKMVSLGHTIANGLNIEYQVPNGSYDGQKYKTATRNWQKEFMPEVFV